MSLSRGAIGAAVRLGALAMLAAGGFAACDEDDETGSDSTVSKECRDYAQAHYSEEQWAQALLEGELEPYFPDLGLGVGTVPSDLPLYVSEEEDSRKWHENIGKWDVFAFGWEEYGPPQAYRPDVDTPDFETPTRTAYQQICGLE